MARETFRKGDAKRVRTRRLVGDLRRISGVRELFDVVDQAEEQPLAIDFRAAA